MAGRALLVKMLIILETPGIFGSNFVYLHVCVLSPSTDMQNNDEASPSIIFAGLTLL